MSRNPRRGDLARELNTAVKAECREPATLPAWSAGGTEPRGQEVEEWKWSRKKQNTPRGLERRSHSQRGRSSEQVAGRHLTWLRFTSFLSPPHPPLRASVHRCWAPALVASVNLFVLPPKNYIFHFSPPTCWYLYFFEVPTSPQIHQVIGCCVKCCRNWTSSCPLSFFLFAFRVLSSENSMNLN